MWYYEEWTTLGRWSPRTEPSEPSEVTSTGTKRKIRAVKKVPDDMKNCDLNELRNWSDDLQKKDFQTAAIDKAVVEVSPPKIIVNPLAWREIDKDHRYVGTGLGFTCEVRRTFNGVWEFVGSSQPIDFADKELAFGAAEKAYAELVLKHVKVEGF
jgi:hypothetical protein